MTKNENNVLEIKNLTVQYPVGEGHHFNAVRDISFDIKKGEVVGLVGESGSGKSTTAKAILALAPHSSGSVKINDELVPNKPRDNKGRVNKWLASKVQMIFQDAKSSLNPREKVFDVVVEGAKNQKLYKKHKLQNTIIFAEKYVKNNLNLKDKKSFELFVAEIEKEKQVVLQRERYEKSFSEIFTVFDDERVIVEGVKSRYKTERNSLKTSYKQYVSNLKLAPKAKQAELKNKFESEIRDIKDERDLMLKKLSELKKDNSSISSSERKGLKKKMLDKSKNEVAELKKTFEIESKTIKEEFSSTFKNKSVSARNKFTVKSTTLKNTFIVEYSKEKSTFKEYTSVYKTKKSELSKNNRVSKKVIDKEYKELVMKIKSTKMDSEQSKNFKKEYYSFKKENKKELTKKAFYREVVKEVMDKVSISSEHINRYPGEFSGGQAQRIAIARTLAMKSDLIIADEPISALDVSIQAQVINLLKKLIKDEELTVLFIAHDLQVVRYISDKIIVMYKGELIEKGEAQEVYNNPKHPYTKTLINAIPSIDDPSRIRGSKPYVAEHIEDFSNYGEIKKEWFKVNENHEIFGTKEQINRWMK